eukprot:6556508-Alexandrium_andersonii.AAC.1
MSASLVGSEMCIRDSARKGWVCLSVGEARPESGRDHHGDHGGAAEGSVAVSYTHLTLPTICSV